MNELDEILGLIKKKMQLLPDNSCDKREYLDHLRALAYWNEEPMDYPEASKVVFPERIAIAHAVCHPDCGAVEFIVDGSSQECEHCGRHLFRTETAEYELVQKEKGKITR